MGKRKLSLLTLLIAVIFSLACNLPLTEIFGPGGTRATSTPDTIPAETDTPAPALDPTQTTAPQAEDTPTEEVPQGLAGEWTGTARWLCDENPLWSLTLDFTSDQSATATLTGPGDPVVANASVYLNGSNIELHFDNALWVGTISGDTMAGTFSEETCSGEWFAARQE
jgi:hypothetical protein